jgi:hypothetical protein
LPILRHDLKPNGTTIPKTVKLALAKFGGRNPYGEAIYRLIRAEDRIIKAPGEWNIWPEHLSVEDRGGLAIDVLQKALMQHRAKIEHALVHDNLQDVEKAAKRFNHEFEELLQSRLNAAPLSTVRGMMEVELYPYDGFILEKWHPASHYGSPDEWNRLTFDGMPAAGPYPEYGDYELLAGPTPYMPTIAQLEDAIRQNFRDVQTRPRSSKERVRLLLEKAEQATIQKDKDIRSRADAFRKDTGALMNRLSLGAGRVRQQLADKTGLKGHYGN